MQEKFQSAEDIVKKFLVAGDKEGGKAAEAAMAPFFVPSRDRQSASENIEVAPGAPPHALILMGRVKAKRRHFSTADIYYTNALNWLRGGQKFSREINERDLWVEAARVKLSRGLSNQARELLTEAAEKNTDPKMKSLFMRELEKIPK